MLLFFNHTKTFFMNSDWKFKFNPRINLLNNLLFFLEDLSFDKLIFEANEISPAFKPNDTIVTINSIYFPGNIKYFVIHISKVVEDFNNYIKNIKNTKETYGDTINMLFECKNLLIKEFTSNNYANFLYLDSLKKINVLKANTNKKYKTTLPFLYLDSDAKYHIQLYQELKQAYLSLLDERIAIALNEFQKEQIFEINESPKNKERSLLVLELWIGLESSDFFSYIKGKNKNKKISQIRYHFFKLFEVDDIDYSTRKRDLLQRKPPVAKFLNQMAEKLNQNQKLKKRKKRPNNISPK
jgi:hypothetical protein